jgi:hypothetical protein
MTDTSDETEDLGEFETEGFSDADYVEVEGAQIIAPHGMGWLADTFGAVALRVTMAKGGSIEVLISQDEGQSWKWLDVTKLKAPAKLVAINGDKAK